MTDWQAQRTSQVAHSLGQGTGSSDCLTKHGGTIVAALIADRIEERTKEMADVLLTICIRSGRYLRCLGGHLAATAEARAECTWGISCVTLPS